jgi:DNA-binding NarL/FixJ family response regulator
MKYNIIIADDHKIFRDGFKLITKSIDNIEQVDEASNGHDLIEKMKTKKPDIIFMDVVMPKMDGIETTKKIHKQYPEIKIIALSAFDDDEHINKMIAHGASGYLTKNTDKKEIKNAIIYAMANKNYFSPQILTKLTNNLGKDEKEKKKKTIPYLAKREKQLLELLCQGYSTCEIAEKMYISHGTVESHKKNIMNKFGINKTLNLILFALKNGIVKIY